MEPASASALSAVVVKAMEEIDKLITEANKIAADDSEHYRKWLEVALRAIQGLEKEYEGILGQAVKSDIASAKRKKELLERINTYIHGENLRLKLKEAIGHLKQGHNVLSKHAERRFQLSKTRQSREEALKEYDLHLQELQGYLGSLGDWSGPSAVALDDLKELEALLGMASSSSKQLQKAAQVLQNSRDKSKLLTTTENAAKTIDALRAAFR